MVKDVNKVIEKLSKKELVELVTKLAEEDGTLRDKLLAKNKRNSPEQELKACQKWFDSIVKKHGDRHGFIVYSKASDFSLEATDILEKAYEVEDPLLGMEIAFLVLKNAVDAFQYTDDSGGDIGYLVSNAMDTIRGLVLQERTGELSADTIMFDRLVGYSESEAFEGWEEYRLELLAIGAGFADQPVLRDKLSVKLRDLLADYAGDDHSSYEAEQILWMLFDLVKQYGTQEEEHQFLEEHLSYSSFRKEAIERSRNQGDYDRILALALEGEELDRKLPGLVNDWRRARYEAYSGLNRTEEQLKLGRELLIGGGTDYYDQLEQLAGGDADDFYKSVLQELKQASGWTAAGVYLKLIEKKNDADEMMDHVRKNPNEIERYAHKLADHFRAEVLSIYQAHIEKAASDAANRKEYRRVCEIIERYKPLAGDQSAEEIVGRMKALYGNKPAFVDELGKVK
ncbi:MAG: zinc finger protein [Paenibacillaceae bacterium]|jgi:hypothetical protein|nr:zinc finger protein [Paenibacillaceae bacterium]